MARNIVVVGGGIAGLSAAWCLARTGARVTVLEREKMLASLASGRNAAIFRVLDPDPTAVALALRTRQMLSELPAVSPLLRVTGGLFVGPRADIALLLDAAHAAQVESFPVDADEAVRRVPVLERAAVEAALIEPGDGVLDIHEQCTATARAARAAGATLRTGVEVTRVLTRSGRVYGVALSDGTELVADDVIVAAGAWSAGVAETCGAHLPIRPVRRHLALLATGDVLAADAPIVWRLGDEVYFRPETGGTLASPCDQEPWTADDPPAAPQALEELALRLSRTAPALASAPVRSTWACLRTFATDGGFVAGPDPRVAGLHWLAALGGHGMTCGLALGEILAARLAGQPHALADAVAPDRLLGAPAPVRGLLLDLDGTLLDTIDDIAAAMTHVLLAHGLPNRTRDEYRSFVGHGALELVQRSLPPDRQDLVEATLAGFRSRYSEHLIGATRPFDGVREALAALVRRGVPLSVLSNKPQAFTERLVAALLPDVPFRAVLGDRPGVPRKPDPAPALDLARRMELAPGDVAIVGDGETDVLAARAAGMRAIAVRWGYRPAADLVRAGAERLLSAPAELATLA